MAKEMWLSGSDDQFKSQGLSEHADRIKDSRRTPEEQAALDSIWGDTPLMQEGLDR